MEYRLFEAHHSARLGAHPRSFLFAISGLLLFAFFFSACSNDKSKPFSAAIPVIVDTVIQKTVPVQLRAIGNVLAYSTVTVKSKVGGELVRVYFTEGQDVRM